MVVNSNLAARFKNKLLKNDFPVEVKPILNEFGQSAL